MPGTRVFNMGACLLNGPLSTAIREGQLGRSTIGRGGSTPGTYSFGEMFQLLDFIEGKKDIPHQYRDICGYRETYEPGPGAKNFSGVDICLIEPNGVVDIDWAGLKVNRAQVQAHVLRPVKIIGPDVAKAANNWYNRGILAANNEVRDELASAIIARLPEGIEGRDFIVSVLTTAQGVKRELASDIATLVQRIPIPIGILAYAYQYLPDGRPMFWPSDLQEQLKAAIAGHDLPYLEPWRLVLEHGGQPVLKPDLRHYQDEFLPTVATYIAQFADRVAERVGSDA